MVEIRDSEEEKQALRKTIVRILERGRQELGKNLKFDNTMGVPDLYSISEKKFFGKNQFFSMTTDINEDRQGKRVITCFVADKSIFDIVKEELQKYADTFKIDVVDIRR